MTKIGLIIDDERTIDQVQSMNNYWLISYDMNQYQWTIVRSQYEFEHHIVTKGLPEIIQFDHDLQDFDSEGNEYTGYTCAKFLCDYCVENNQKLPKFVVHTGNPVGKDNIESLLNQFIKHYE